ncbi:hypothetical protein ACV33P_30185, partial [Pseudomonas aeruginosa]
GPVVDDFQPGAVARDEGQLLAALVVHRQGRHPLRVECAGAVELAPVQAVAVAVGPLAQILHAAIDAGIARGAFEDTLRFVRERARPWVDSGVDKASDDPLTIHEIGRLAIRLHAAEALL